MLFVLIERDALPKIMEFAVYRDFAVALPQKVIEKLVVFALPAHHERRKNPQFQVAVVNAHHFFIGMGSLLDRLQNGAKDFFVRKFLYFPTTEKAVGLSHPRVEDAQVIVYFGDGRHRRAGVVGAGFLVNRNRGREAGNFLDIRLLHLPQELPRVGRKRLHIAPLTFRENGIERQ